MDPSRRRLSGQTEPPHQVEQQSEQGEGSQAVSLRLKPAAQLTLMRYLQDLPDAEVPPSPVHPRYHTGRLPNGSKSGDGKPRLLLMGQRR